MKRILILFSSLISINCYSQKDTTDWQDTLSTMTWSMDSIPDEYIVKFNTYDSGFGTRLVIRPEIEIRDISSLGSRLVAYKLYGSDKLVVIDSAATIATLFFFLKQQADYERKKYINK